MGTPSSTGLCTESGGTERTHGPLGGPPDLWGVRRTSGGSAGPTGGPPDPWEVRRTLRVSAGPKKESTGPPPANQNAAAKKLTNQEQASSN